MNNPIKVLVVDDHMLVRFTLRDRIQREPRIEVVGTAGDADEAMDLAIKLTPDIILMDIDMPGVACFEAVRTMETLCPDARVIFLSAFFHDRYIEEALKVKALGYLTKQEPPEAIIKAILAVASGGACYSKEIQSRIVADQKHGLRLAMPVKTRASTLTNREMEVLRYIARGLPKKKIAELMHLSVRTAENHASRLMHKLDIHDRVELTRYAIREGLVDA